ncbi:MAG: hypothetical protein LKJ80_03025 [Oscillibacter sp.]|jgi:ABC-2 type transport system permease protein|nr:hypothetical protein [Oscillibacter sp.]
MRSKTSSFKGGGFSRTLLGKNLTRFWPLWAVYTAAWLIMGPLMQLMLLSGASAQGRTQQRLAADAAGQLLNVGTKGGLWMGVIFGCLFAMALFSYLCSPRATGLMHAFPIRREGLFVTNYLSGVAAFLGADVLTLALTAAVQGAAGVLVWKNLLIWFACAAGMMLFFYSFAVFCAMFTGQLLAIPAFYVALNGLAAGVNTLVQSFASAFLYGYTGGGTPAWVRWLTPAWKLGRDVNTNSTWSSRLDTNINYRVEGLESVAVYAAAGLAFAALALLVCRVRRSETAGDTVTVGWAGKLFRVGVSVCCALSLGQGLYYLIWNQLSRGGNSLTGILACMVFLGLVGYFAAEMLLRKSFRVFRSSWKGAAAVTAALLIFGACVRADVTGVVARVPAASDIRTLIVSVGGQNYCSAGIRDPELIEKFREVHRAVIGERETMQQREKRSYAADADQQNSWITLEYQLKNGSSVRRNYEIYYTPDEVKDAGTAISKLAELVTEPAFQRANLLGTFLEQQGRITGGEMSFTAYRPSGSGAYGDYAAFDAAAAQQLYDALCADIDQGHFGVNQFDQDRWDQETYSNNLTLYYSIPGREADGGGKEMDSINVEFSVRCTNLRAALEKTGALNGAVLETYAQRDAWNGKAPAEAETHAVIGGADGPTEILVD